jgi:hypothetical protein
MKKTFRIDQPSPNTKPALQTLDESSPSLRLAGAYKPRYHRYQVTYKIVIDSSGPPPPPPPPNMMDGGDVGSW